MTDEIFKDSHKLILVEGDDALHFYIALLGKLESRIDIQGIQVMNFGGITDLAPFLAVLPNREHYGQISSLCIARDCETHEGETALSASNSINHALQAARMTDKDIRPFHFEQFDKKIGFVLFPGYNESGELEKKGTLEDLCLKICVPEIPVEEVSGYVDDFERKRPEHFKRPHKNRFHAALSFSDDYVGLKIGEAAKASAFDFNSPYLQPFIQMIQEVVV
jgi:hypothetical protein